MIRSYSPVKIVDYEFIWCFFVCLFRFVYVLFVLFLEGRGEEANEHDVKKMKLPGCWGEGYGHL